MGMAAIIASEMLSAEVESRDQRQISMCLRASLSLAFSVSLPHLLTVVSKWLYLSA